jgi:hypothetical protein
MKLTWRTFPLFFWGQFLTGFCFHLVLPAVLLFLAGLVLGVIGVRFGLLYLVWNEYPFKQAIVGFAVFLLVWEVMLVGYLLEAQRTPYADRFRFKRGGPALAHFVGLLLSSALVLVIFWAGRALVLNVGLEKPLAKNEVELKEVAWHPPYHGLPFAGGALLATVLGLYFTSLRWLDPSTRPLMRKIGAMVFRFFGRFPFLGVRKPDDEDLYLHGVAAMSWLVAFIFFFVAGYFLPWFSPIVGICFLLHITVAVFAFIAYFVPRVTPLVLVLLFGLLWLGGIPSYKQRFPGLEAHYDKPVALGKQDDNVPNPPLLKLKDIDFCKLDLGMHPANRKRPLVVVCASGGGLRSAAWTLAVLQEIEKELRSDNIRFPYHIRVINGASGGMLGSCCYVLSLGPPDKEPVREPDEVRKQLMQDSLSPVVHQLAYGDLWSMFWPRPVNNDRGRELEKAWKDNLNDLLEMPFDTLSEGERDGWRPSLVFSPMLVEDGRRLFISNLDLDDLAQNRTSIVPGCEDTLSTSAFELFRLYPDPQTRRNFKVVTAARMSASFPYVAPAVALPTIPRRRVVDAGYYDNYGVSLPSAWLMSKETIPWIHKYVSGVLLIQIRDGQLEQERKLSEGILADTSKPLSRGVEELTSPPEGLVTGQDAAAIFRNDQQLDMLGQLLAHEVKGRRVEKDFFTTVTFELTKKASLSWCLTEEEKELIQTEAKTTVGGQMKKVTKWWHDRPQDIPVK